MSDDRKPPTTTILNRNRVDPTPPPERDVDVTQPLSEAWRIHIYIEGKLVFNLFLKAKMLIGRNLEPDPLIDIDLTQFAAYLLGVSRHHAYLHLIDGKVYVEDNGSTNGTSLNGGQLTRQQKVLLRDRDELELGQLRMTVRFVYPGGKTS